MEKETDKKEKRTEKEQVEEELEEDIVKHGINQLSRHKAHRFSVL